jgi:hypothetical protein
MAEVNVDYIGPEGAQGDVAGRVSSGLDVNRMRPFIDPSSGKPFITVHTGGDPNKPENYSVRPVNNATLRRDEWKRLDDAVMKVAEERLRGVADLKNRGLTYNVPNGMGTTVLEYHDVSDALSATMTMDGINRGQNDRPEYTTNYLPLPIVHADYEINQRVLTASRNMGNPLDTTLAERASRRVNEFLEDMLFTDTTYSFGGGTIYSYLNHPSRNTAGFQNAAWTNSGTTAQDIVQDVLNMKQTSIEANHFGPWALYVPTGYETLLDDDYDTSGQSTQTIRQRIQAIDGINTIMVIDKLPADTVVLVEMTSEVVRWVNGMALQNVEWSSEGGMITNYKVMTIQVPQIRADQEGQSGVVHLS